MTFDTDAELARRARSDPAGHSSLATAADPDEEAALDLTAETFARAMTAIRR